MISFKAFIRAINDAIFEANSGLEQNNLNLLNDFFVNEDGKSPQEVYINDNGETNEDVAAGKDTFKPRTVKIQYPDNSGGSPVEVNVPLITLVPITASKIDVVKLSSEFRMNIVDNELQLDFPKKGVSGSGSILEKKPIGTLGKLEIILRPGEVSEGLDSIIEGYEKVLKMQIPH